eukprot:COSAG01_NODE_18614_length_1064_cov_1.808290_3_plen_62_part_01
MRHVQCGSGNQTGYLYFFGKKYVSPAKAAVERVIRSGCRFDECDLIFASIHENQVGTQLAVH